MCLWEEGSLGNSYVAVLVPPLNLHVINFLKKHYLTYEKAQSYLFL